MADSLCCNASCRHGTRVPTIPGTRGHRYVVGPRTWRVGASPVLDDETLPAQAMSVSLTDAGFAGRSNAEGPTRNVVGPFRGHHCRRQRYGQLCTELDP